MSGKKHLKKLSMERQPARSPEIGDRSVSCTLYPDIFPLDAETYFCDTAGFGDSCGEAEAIFATLAVQMAVRAACRVKCVIGVVEEAQFDVGRGEAFKAMAQTLVSMFRGTDFYSSLFLFINKGERTKGELRHRQLN